MVQWHVVFLRSAVDIGPTANQPIKSIKTIQFIYSNDQQVIWYKYAVVSSLLRHTILSHTFYRGVVLFRFTIFLISNTPSNISIRLPATLTKRIKDYVWVWVMRAICRNVYDVTHLLEFYVCLKLSTLLTSMSQKEPKIVPSSIKKQESSSKVMRVFLRLRLK